MRRVMVALALVLAARPAAAVELPQGAVASEQVRAVEAIDGATLRLADGRLLRLAALAVPLASDGRGERRADEAAERVRQALAALALRDLALVVAGARIDRYRRVLAHAAIDGRWLQGELVAAGFARVAVDPDQRAWVRELLPLEEAARAAGRGLWGAGVYRVLPAARPGRFIDGFQIVEGRVASVQAVRGATYLAFGGDARNDVTVAVPAGLRSALRAAGLDPARLAGVILRVRGEVRFQNGPLIEVAAPEQIERVR